MLSVRLIPRFASQADTSQRYTDKQPHSLLPEDRVFHGLPMKDGVYMIPRDSMRVTHVKTRALDDPFFLKHFIGRAYKPKMNGFDLHNYLRGNQGASDVKDISRNFIQTSRHFTMFYRDIIFYPKLAELLLRKFPEGASVNIHGASNRMETYTFMFGLLNQLKKNKPSFEPDANQKEKTFQNLSLLREKYPIRAVEYDKFLHENCVSGKIEINEQDARNIRGMGSKNIFEDCFEQPPKAGHFQANQAFMNGCGDYINGDAFEDAKQLSQQPRQKRMIISRNWLCYCFNLGDPKNLLPDSVKNYFENLSQASKVGSVLVLGAADMAVPPYREAITKLLYTNGFIPISTREFPVVFQGEGDDTFTTVFEKVVEPGAGIRVSMDNEKNKPKK